MKTLTLLHARLAKAVAASRACITGDPELEVNLLHTSALPTMRKK